MWLQFPQGVVVFRYLCFHYLDFPPLKPKSHSVCLHALKFSSFCPDSEKDKYKNIQIELFPWLMKMNIPQLFPFMRSCVHIQTIAT